MPAWVWPMLGRATINLALRLGKGERPTADRPRPVTNIGGGGGESRLCGEGHGGMAGRQD